jgi:hypothetical protein
MREQYLDRSIDLVTLSIPLLMFPKLTRVIPQSETICTGWSAFIDAVAPTPAPVVQEKKDVPYVIAGTQKPHYHKRHGRNCKGLAKTPRPAERDQISTLHRWDQRSY